MMLRESSEDASMAVVAADGDEAIGTVRWTATPTQAGRALSSVPFTPSQLRVLLQTPRLLLHLSGTVGGANTNAAFDFALDSDLSGPRDVSVHAIADSTSADAYLYFDGRPFMRVAKYGFSNVDVNAALALVPKEGVRELSTASCKNSNLPRRELPRMR
ncbi:hypothetical protein EXIGLDRAFT_197512 [Exidia glandulosa HHB12029]|uniref:Uncharacterized protein n=1 Tax=Exidia glandulosa HHB12029 TaxID=1314781 RepID=A0A165ET11_EXIGL|nr:hypothetical protein EXIGLDRAFT_197512 [Exidia glandulosa HHB12029]